MCLPNAIFLGVGADVMTIYIIAQDTTGFRIDITRAGKKVFSVRRISIESVVDMIFAKVEEIHVEEIIKRIQAKLPAWSGHFLRSALHSAGY